MPHGSARVRPSLSTERCLQISLPAKRATEAPRNKHRCSTRVRLLPVPPSALQGRLGSGGSPGFSLMAETSFMLSRNLRSINPALYLF